ncbi:MAG: glutamate mutase L, partial [Candidatus Cloacimonetes bacterium]|nr:glutamate mutase L [Candidatus Cloacimonadota bacterium]MCK9185525.1 glutamate mutase L [Candidatus Cloacimonadota bacterium]
MPEIDFILITDIGSTTTKAILIDKKSAELLCIEQADTTVEKPKNDVNYGVFNAAVAVEKSCNIKVLDSSSRPDNPKFLPNVKYLSTSSAGGGLQILVVGLTLFDSASSAKRAAYGAGGVILDVFAIDDRRSALQQMLNMRNLRPDMILLCGGTDGGAIVSVLRLAEILRIAKPLPKFSTENKIPTIYAGNTDASEMIERMISQDFDLYILPNLRPTLDTENLKPTQTKIQELFMENVMERAPGYSKLKQIVNQSILPTPAGVLKSILNLRNEEKQNLIAFDVGGATTDVFTRINEHYQRTVSANLGMSYSALNVLKESGIDAIKEFLPDSISETEIRNYIGNKTLYPTSNPQSQKQYRIEHALAKCALKLSFVQHQQMHFNTEKVGYLEAIKNSTQDKYQ